MAESLGFVELLQQVRDGDPTAARQFVHQFEPLIRREVRLRLLDRRLLRVFDSADISQAVWSSFFTRAVAGRFELQAPEQLAGLLATMTRNKIASAAKKERRNCRDLRRLAPQSDKFVDTVVDCRPSPSEDVASLESLEQLRSRLSTDERQLAEMRVNGMSWIEIAERCGGTPHGRRMQLSRAVRRVLDSGR